MEEQIQPQPQMATVKHGGVVGIILTFIITALVVGGAVYYWQQTVLTQKVNDSVATAMQESNKEILDLRQQMEELRQEMASTEKDEDHWDITLYKDLSIYTDSELGLSFSYPKDFSMSNEGANGKLFSSSYGHFWLKYSDNTKDLKTAQDIKNDYYDNDSYGYQYQDSFVKLNDLDVYKQGRYDLGVIENYYFLLNNKIVKFNFEFNFDAKDEDLQSKYKNLIASVVNSIKSTSLSDLETYNNSWDGNSAAEMQIAFGFSFEYPSDLKVDKSDMYRFLREKNEDTRRLARISVQGANAFERYKQDTNNPNAYVDDYIVHEVMNSCAADGVKGSIHCKEALITERGENPDGLTYYKISMKEVSSTADDNWQEHERNRGPVYVLDIKEASENKYSFMFIAPEDDGISYANIAGVLKIMVDSFKIK